MLFVSTTAAAGFGGLSEDLASLAKTVDKCIKAFPLTGPGINTLANVALNCDFKVNRLPDGLPAFEKLTLLEPADNGVMFDLALKILTLWINTDLGAKPQPGEENTRRIAAAKLGEDAVVNAGAGLANPVLAVQTLATAGRREAVPSVQLAIITSLRELLRPQTPADTAIGRKQPDIPASVRAEAITTLESLASSIRSSNPAVLAAADVALKVVQPEITLEIGPATVTSLGKPRSRFLIPVIVTAATAAVAAGTLWFVFRQRPTHAHALNAVGPLRRRAEVQIRRRRVRSRPA
jgi:hypothetical protein